MDEFGKGHDEHIKNHPFAANLTHKVIIDNFDFRSSVHDMTEEHQDTDMHWVSVASNANRIVNDTLSDKLPPDDMISKIDNSIFVPSAHDHAQQMRNYADICGRIAQENIKCIKDLGDVSVNHIKHQYSKEMTKQTDTVSLIKTLYFCI